MVFGGSKRVVRTGVVVAVLALLVAAGPARGAANDRPGTGADAYRYLSAYADLGLHRTGTGGNTRTAEWLADQFRAIGLQTSTQDFSFPQFVPNQVSLQVGSFSPATFPLYYSGSTGPSGVTAPIVDEGLGTQADFARTPATGKIALVRVPMPLPGLVPTLGSALKNADAAGAAGVIASVDAPLNTLFSPDVDARGGMCNLPTVFVGADDGERLRGRADLPATLTLDADYSSAGSGANVIGVLPGASKDVIAIGTPITGWFNAATERGAGIGAMLTLARALVAESKQHPLPQTLMFLGTSGHEVGFLGLDEFLRANPELVPRLTAYLHFGAAVAAKKVAVVGDKVITAGTADEERFLTASENPLLAGLAWSAAAAGPVVPVLPAPQGAGASGEEVFAYNAGVPTVAIKSTFAWMHTPRDLPDGTSAGLLDPVVRMYRTLAEQLLTQDPSLVRQANTPAVTVAKNGPPPPFALGVISCASY